MQETIYYVYVLRNPQGRIYVGSTDDLDRRVQQHQQGETRWTRNRGPWTLALAESFPTRADAMRREKKLKCGRANQQLRERLKNTEKPQNYMFINDLFNWPMADRDMAMNNKSVILIVDSATQSAELQRSHLDRLNFEILTASNSGETLKALAGRDIDLILINSAISKKEALSLVKHLSSGEKTMAIPVLLVAGTSEKAGERKGRGIEWDDFISGPVDISTLTATADALIRLKKCHDRTRSPGFDMDNKAAEQIKELNTALGLIEETAFETVQRLTAAAECRDQYTGSHILRISHYAAAIARKMGLDDGFIETMLRAAPLHDIGKIGIPDKILKKPGKLDDSEWEIMQRHTIIGGDILSGLKKDYIKMAREIALTHHEKWNGTGYPRGLEGENIPISGRIAAVADVFDALISRRPYKPPLSLRESFTVIKNEKGTHFDPAVVGAFTSIKQEIMSIVERYKDSL